MANGFSAPFGDIFYVKTPALDRMEERLHDEELKMKMLREKQAADLDEQLAKNVANIRDADVDDFTKAYQDWKASKQQLIKSKNIPGPEYAKMQMSVNQKLADIYKLLNASKAHKQNEEDLGKRIIMKPDDFNDNASGLLITSRNTPLKGLKAYQTTDAQGNPATIDLSDAENYLYRDKTNWQPILQKAGGTVTQRGNPIEKLMKDGLQYEVTSYKGGNDPLTYYNSILGSLATPRAGESLTKRFQFTPDEAQSITDEFERLKTTPEFQTAYGDVKFPESSNMSAASRTAKLLAMQHAINNRPTSSVAYKPNLAAITKRREDFQREMTQKRHQNSLQRLWIWAGIQANKPMSPNEIATGIDNLIAGHIKSAADNGGELLVDAETFKALTGQVQTKNSYITIGPDGTYQYGKKVKELDKDGKETGNSVIDQTTLKPVPFQLARGKLMESYPKTRPVTTDQKEAVKEAAKEKFPLPKGKPKTVKQNGFTYTWNPNTGKYE